MKKLLGIILVLCLMFSGCAKEQNTSSEQATKPATEETASAETSEASEEAVSETSKPISDSEKGKTKEEMAFKEETVYFAVVVQNEDKVILDITPVSIEKGDTALSVLKRVMKENKIHMETSGKGDSEYVKGINNLYEFDKGPQSGWIFYVNGESPSQSAGKTVLADGDMVEWVYITEWTEGE